MTELVLLFYDRLLESMRVNNRYQLVRGFHHIYRQIFNAWEKIMSLYGIPPYQCHYLIR
ncbi:MAG: hypothetical protein M1294_11265 [Firmicutes bacterium]|nr:hypothetical protein [Bacillota bacterium]MCL5012706.1 hypothetical protein [Bacillota bacterium]